MKPSPASVFFCQLFYLIAASLASPQKLDKNVIKKAAMANQIVDNEKARYKPCKTCSFKRTVVNKYQTITSVFYTNQDGAERLSIFSNPPQIQTFNPTVTASCNQVICPTKVVLDSILTSTNQSPVETMISFVPVVVFTNTSKTVTLNPTVTEIIHVDITVDDTETINYVSYNYVTVDSTMMLISGDITSTINTVKTVNPSSVSLGPAVTITNESGAVTVTEGVLSTVLVNLFSTVTNLILNPTTILTNLIPTTVDINVSIGSTTTLVSGSATSQITLTSVTTETNTQTNVQTSSCLLNILGIPIPGLPLCATLSINL
jgi:hypothetical protein